MFRCQLLAEEDTITSHSITFVIQTPRSTSTSVCETLEVQIQTRGKDYDNVYVDKSDAKR